MFKCRFPVLVLVLALSSCSPDKEAEITHLDTQKMTDVMTDLSLMEAAASMKVMSDPKKVVDTNFRFNIYQQHNIRKGQYDSSLLYYSQHPKEFKEIYDKVIEKLDRLKSN